MEDNSKLIEPLFEKAVDFVKPDSGKAHENIAFEESVGLDKFQPRIQPEA